MWSFAKFFFLCVLQRLFQDTHKCWLESESKFGPAVPSSCLLTCILQPTSVILDVMCSLVDSTDFRGNLMPIVRIITTVETPNIAWILFVPPLLTTDIKTSGFLEGLWTCYVRAPTWQHIPVCSTKTSACHFPHLPPVATPLSLLQLLKEFCKRWNQFHLPDAAQLCRCVC
jgi:hypothetical protein